MLDEMLTKAVERLKDDHRAVEDHDTDAVTGEVSFFTYCPSDGDAWPCDHALVLDALATSQAALAAALEREAQQSETISHWKCSNCGREWDHDPEPTETLFCRSNGGHGCAEYAVAWKSRAQLAEARLSSQAEVEKVQSGRNATLTAELAAALERAETLREVLQHIVNVETSLREHLPNYEGFGLMALEKARSALAAAPPAPAAGAVNP